MTTCRVCPAEFTPRQPLQVVCSLKCAQRVPVIARNTLKAEKRADRARLVALKPRSYWVRGAQIAFNAWIRARDAAEPCISCGRDHVGQWHAGHYLSTGARPELRFDELNVHRQCAPCNSHLHGNLVLYRVNLVTRIGLDAVRRLEGPHPAKKHTSDDLRAIADEYRRRTREMCK